MKNKDLPDFSDPIRKMFELSAFIKELRKGFNFTKDDAYAKKEKAFLEHWHRLRDIQQPKKK